MATKEPAKAQDQDAAGTVGFYRNQRGELCYGQSCITMRVAEDGLVFNLDPEECDEETRTALLTAVFKGPRVHVGKRDAR